MTDTKRARELAAMDRPPPDLRNAYPMYEEVAVMLESLADEVDGLREDAVDCEQALSTNGELCDQNAELERAVETKWKPLLARLRADYQEERACGLPMGFTEKLVELMAACEEKP